MKWNCVEHHFWHHRSINAAAGDTVNEDFPLVTILPGDGTDATSEDQKQSDLGYIRPDLEEALQRHHYGFDEADQAGDIKLSTERCGKNGRSG